MNKTVERIINLINNKGIEQKTFVQAIGVKTNAVSDWKSGRTKSYTKYLDKIANYLGVSVNYLVGNEVYQNETLSKHEQELIEAYRNQLEMQQAVDRLLGITEIPPQRIVQTKEPELEVKYARSDNLAEMTPRKLTKEQWDALENGEDVKLN